MCMLSFGVSVTGALLLLLLLLLLLSGVLLLGLSACGGCSCVLCWGGCCSGVGDEDALLVEVEVSVSSVGLLLQAIRNFGFDT